MHACRPSAHQETLTAPKFLRAPPQPPPQVLEGSASPCCGPVLALPCGRPHTRTVRSVWLPCLSTPPARWLGPLLC